MRAFVPSAFYETLQAASFMHRQAWLQERDATGEHWERDTIAWLRLRARNLVAAYEATSCHLHRTALQAGDGEGCLADLCLWCGRVEHHEACEEVRGGPMPQEAVNQHHHDWRVR